MTLVPHTLLEGLGFPESLRWRDGCLYFSDFISRQVNRLDDAGTCETLAFLLGQPSGLGILADNNILAVSMFDNSVVCISEKGVALKSNLRQHSRGPSNDLIIDRSGRAYVGCFGYNLWYESRKTLPSAPLCLVDESGDVRVVAEDLLFPNGMALLDDESVLLVAESYGNRITAFNVSADGTLSDRRVFADLGSRSPDGMGQTPAGGVWVACPMQEEVILVGGGGELLEVVGFPGRMPTDCVLAERPGPVLLVGTSTPESMRSGRMTGAIEAVEV